MNTKSENTLKILELYNTRQKIYQITHNYGTKRNKYYKNKYIKNCELCGLKFDKLNLHHKDKNVKNRNPNNLMLLCHKCHKILHKLNKWARNYDKCIKCNSTKIKHMAKGFCEKCYRLNYKEKNKQT